MINPHLIKKIAIALMLAISLWVCTPIPENQPDMPQLQIVIFEPIMGLFPEDAGASSYYGGPCGRTCHFGCCLHLVCSKCEDTTDQPPMIIGTLNCAQDGANGWCVGALTLNLSASDPQRASIIISGNVNGVPFACPSGASSCSVPLTEEGVGVVEYTVSSATGLSVTHDITYQLDLSTPQLEGFISGVAGTNSWYRSNALLALTSSDTISGIAFTETSIDGASWATYTSPLSFTDGVYAVNLRAVDNAGNVTQDTQFIQVDTITPNLSLLVSGVNGKNDWYVSNIIVTPNVTDSGSGIALLEAAIDGGVWTAVADPLAGLSFTNGSHTYHFRATDNAGNITEAPVQTIKIDTTPPVVEMTEEINLGDVVYYNLEDNGSGLFTYRAVIEDEGERYKKVVWLESIDGNKLQDQILWDGKFKDGTSAGLGDYYITLKILDAAGNESTKTAIVHVNPLSFLQDLPPFTLPATLEPVSTYQAEEGNTVAAATTNFGGEIVAWGAEDYVTAGFSTAGTTAAPVIPTSNIILWGAGAVAALGAFFADVERRKLEQRQKNNRQKELANAFQASLDAFEAGLIAGGISPEEAHTERGQALLTGEIPAVATILYNQHMEDKMTILEAIDDVKWTETQEAIQVQLEEEKQKLNDVSAARWAGIAMIEETKLEEVSESKWWENVINWIDDHQTELSIVTGLVVAITTVALVVTATASLPVLAAIGIAALIAGGVVTAGTVALNAYYGRDLMTNLISNLTTAVVTAAVATGIGMFIFGGGMYVVGSSVTVACANNPTICARIEPILGGIDSAEQAFLQVKLAYQIWTGNDIAALETKTELDLEYMDGGMPGNVIVNQVGDLGADALELVSIYGDDVIPLLLQYGNDAVDIIGAYGDDGIEALLLYGDEAVDLILVYGTPAVNLITSYGDEGIVLLHKYGIGAEVAVELVAKFGEPATELLNMVDPVSAKKLLETLDSDVLEYAMEQGPDAVFALSRWSEKELQEFGPELALRAKKDAKVMEDISKLISLGSLDPKNLTAEQKELINSIAENSMQYTDEGQIVLGKWVDYGHGFTSYARETGSVHYNPHPDMWELFGEFGKLREDTAWLVNKEVIQIGIDKGLPFEYTLEGVPIDTVPKEQDAIQLLFSGATELEVKQALKLNSLPIRMKELQELEKAGYNFTFDEISNSFIFSLP